MFYVSQVDIISGPNAGKKKWAVKDRFTHKTAKNPYGLGRAYFDTREQAGDAMEDCVAAAEADCS